MAEHADAAQEELSETSRRESSPAMSRHAGEGSSEPRDGVAEKTSDAASASDPSADVSAEQGEDFDAAIADEGDASKEANDASEQEASVKKRMSPVQLATALGLAVVVALGTLAGWFGFCDYQSHRAQQQRALLLQVARQGALNLTTIDWEHADADIRRIQDSATGAFYDDFSKRSKPFIEVVKKAQSKSVGTVTEAGMESQSGDEAQVLVAVSVKTSNLGAAEQEPRHWRMRISLQSVGNEVKVSNVAFVP